MTDADLYARGIRTLLAAWELFAGGSQDASVFRFEGGSAAIFPHEPERQVYNNAIPTRDLPPDTREAAIAAIVGKYAAAGVDKYAVWVHESDRGMRAHLERRGYAVSETTRAMGIELDGIRIPRPKIDLGPADLHLHRLLLGLPPCLLDGIATDNLRVLVARLDGENAATALALDHDGDCGIFNVGTLEPARRRGLATALTALHLYEAVARGCRTASIQSTRMAERVYASVGFRDLGRILEYAPPMPALSSTGGTAARDGYA